MMESVTTSLSEKKAKAALEDSFLTFNQLASDLTGAYVDLENRLSLLSNKLEHVTQERLIELTEKECLANRLQKLLTMLPTAVVVLDGRGTVKECNQAAVKLLERELIGVAWRDIMNQVFRPKEDDGCEISLWNNRRVNIAIQALQDEPGQIIVMNDLTETRALQEQVAHDKRLKEMGKMVASLAHQIRTPLTAALLYLSNMLTEKLNNQQQQQSLEKVKARLINIEEQIKDMLLCAKGGRLNLNEVGVGVLLTNLESLCVDKLNNDEVSFMINNHCESDQIFCHEATLLGAFYNVINNAVENAATELNITADREDNGKVKFIISDNGPGIDEGIINQVTKPFFTTRSSGTGLGLDIVKAVMTEHDGSLEIFSGNQRGTTVQLIMPAVVSTK